MSRIICALDYNTLDEVKRTVDTLGDGIAWYKVGLQLYLATGASTVSFLKSKGKNVFLDLKFFDIPNTVGHAVANACSLGADMMTVHALGGKAMIAAAAESIHKANAKTTLLAVTILTSVDESILTVDMGLSPPIEKNVTRLAALAASAGASGIVCSPFEIAPVRNAAGPSIRIVTPGVRMPGESAHDQKRVATPMQAFKDGCDFVVMGRSITGAQDPAQVIRTIEQG